MTARPGAPAGADSGQPAIHVRGLSHSYESPRGEIRVLRGLDLEVGPGRYVALAGDSGEGKSTLLALLGGLQRVQSGELVVGGHDLRRLRASDMALFRSRTVGFVFQHHGLLESLTARENVALAMSLAGHRQADSERRALGLLAQVGLSDRADHLPGRLSGGERQRVAVARAMANQPALILADEPTGNLDERNAGRVLDLLEAAWLQQGATLVIVTHDRSIAERAETRLQLHEGRLKAA